MQISPVKIFRDGTKPTKMEMSKDYKASQQWKKDHLGKAETKNVQQKPSNIHKVDLDIGSTFRELKYHGVPEWTPRGVVNDKEQANAITDHLRKEM
mmetsp:Transcript_11500/g.20682  ORF Transcript_11500/g.20682 Transcript_11500/m.20682 type:complete len:96 (+) Transcript_11500:167-454(+)|eukprot:CAMPEP_0201598792 /NCGR_PEP_ID=MMETSP0492-20130828/494_1 /ASSEMBLY_ACC=CAM_ASM_000837 /TAXON_ID=420259 /ORGANISM="Thalassiosira gravida, Strain GMp14c1" /LENGTH=95 /DNA_ID=CAMNT_0048061269 /DNA_START=195 /DNA_END=482 /DNA_ORIENTATION=-